MRCGFCRQISVDSTNGHSFRAVAFRSWQSRPRIGISHVAGFEALRKSARQGCDLCRVFEEAFLESWDMTPYAQLEQDGVSTQIRVRSDLYLPGLINTNDTPEIASHLTVELCIPGTHSRENSIEEPYITFQIYAQPDDRTFHDPRIIGRPLSQNPEDAVALFQTSMQFCHRRHDKCKPIQEQRLPTRVLYVGDDTSETPKLLLTGGELGVYATLSYCWGPTQLLVTTKATLATRMDGIPLETMPKTFTDAIRVCRVLGMPCLWIDALCIIQDSEEDWMAESAQMGAIYAGSAFTIAATMSTGSHQGFLNPKDPKFVQPLARLDHIVPRTQLVSSIYLRRSHDSWKRSISDGVLAQRAWTLQERLLANRVMHFGDVQAFWECNQMCISEGSMDPRATLSSSLDNINPETKQPFREGFRKDLLFGWGHQHGKSQARLGLGYQEGDYRLDAHEISRWYICLADFSQRAMTKVTDKLPAIAGLAKAFAEKIGQPENYLAGLWRSDLLRGLLWVAVLNGKLKRQTTYIAPSWSWASVEGPIHVNMDRLDRSDGQHDASIIGVSIEYQDSNPFGRVTGGVLTLSTKVRHAMYMGDMRKPNDIPVTRHRTHVTYDGRDARSYSYALYERCKGTTDQFEPVATCWFDEDPGTDPESAQMVVALIQIGHWAQLFTTQLETNEDGKRREVFVRRDPNAKYRSWALVARWIDHFADDLFDSKKLARIGVACMRNNDAFESWPVMTVNIY